MTIGDGERLTNAETITRLADTALDLHTRARARIEPGGDTIGDGMPHAGGFGPRSPDNGAMMSLSDSLTVAAHNLLEWLWGAGIKPREHLPGLWTRRNLDTFGREVLGDNSKGEGMHYVHASIRRNAPWIAGLPGIEWPLAELERVVNMGLRIFPQEDTRWVSPDEAARQSGRTIRTLRAWHETGMVKVLNDNWGLMYDINEVLNYSDTLANGMRTRINVINAGRNDSDNR